jgi:dienelactone hydrolase
VARARAAAAAAVFVAGLTSAPPPSPAMEPSADAGRPVVHQGVAGLLWPPAGAPTGRVPAVAIALDAPGVDRRARRYAAQLSAAGILALEVELFPASADGAGPAGAPGDEAAAAALLAAAAAALTRDPRVDPARVGVLGFGAGGRAALVAAPGAGGRRLFAARAALYPGCGALLEGAVRQAAASGPGAAARGGPVLLMHGGADPANPPAACAGLAAAIGETAPVRRIEYRGAGFAWDWTPIGAHETTSLPGPGAPGRWRAAPWPELSEMSAAQVAGFFAVAFSAQAHP